MSEYRKEEDGQELFSDGEFWFSERNVCNGCREEREANDLPYQFADERHSFGIYAGRYCDPCWEKSGYKDADASEFDPTYAGERLDDDY